MAALPPLQFFDNVQRRALLALELRDPVTGLAVGDRVVATIKGLAPPRLAPSGRFVWTLTGPPVAQEVTVDLVLDNPMYGKPAEALPPDPPPPPDAGKGERFRLRFNVPANDGTNPPASLLKPFNLTTTAHYVPAAGTTAVVGRLLEGGGSRQPMPGVKVKIVLRHDGGTGTFPSGHFGLTDERGEFAAMLKGVTDEKPDPAPVGPGGAIAGAIDAWLSLEHGQDQRNAPIEPPLRLGRLAYLASPLKWAPDPP